MPVIGARGTASRGYFGGGTTPGAPIITSSTQGVSSLSIAFTAPVFNGGLLITRYEQAFSVNNSTWSPWALASSSTTPPTSPVNVGGLTNGQAYFIKIRAVNGLGAGPESNVWNTTTTPRTVPNAPTLGLITRGYRRLTIAFTAPAFNGGSAITNYEFSTNNGATWTSMSQSGTANYIITGLADFTSYNVRVRAVNVAGAGAESNMVTAVTAGVTNAPAGLSAGSNGVSQSVLSWTAPDSNASPISDYVVQRSTSSNFSSDIVTFADGVSTSTSTTVTGLNASTTYYFRVASVNQVGQSGWSSIVSATTAGVPSQVGTPTSSAGDKSFTISWSAPATNGSAITSYSVQYSSNGGSSWSTAESFSSPSAEFTGRSKTWTGLSNGTSYMGRVLATNAVGSGASYSSASTSRTPTFAAPALSADGNYNAESSPYTRKVTWSINPTDIVGSTATAGTTTEVYVQWILTASGTDPGTPEELVATYTGNQADGGSGSSFVQSGPVQRNEQYRVRAVQSDGVHTVGTGWVNVTIIGTRSRQPADVPDWSYESGVNIYTTGTFNRTSKTYRQVATATIGGVNTENIGDVQYQLTQFVIVASSTGSASTSTRYFRVKHSGTNTATPGIPGSMPNVADTSPNSSGWPNAGNTSMTYTWNCSNIEYGVSAGKGYVMVEADGTDNTPTINIVITARGNKRTRYWRTPSIIYW